MDPKLTQILSQPTEEERQELAKKLFDDFIASHPSRQRLKKFMQSRADAYMKQTTAPRKERRLVALSLAKRMQKKGLNGEI